MIMPAVTAFADRPMVIDAAGLYTADEIREMEIVISWIRYHYQIDIVVMTTYDVPSGGDSETVVFADNWYDENGYGYGEDKSGALLLTDMTNRFNYISTCGVMIDYMSDSRIEQVLDAWDEQLSSGFGRAMIAELNAIESCLAEGIEEGHFRYDDVTGERLSEPYSDGYSRSISWEAAAGIVLFLMMQSVFPG